MDPVLEYGTIALLTCLLVLSLVTNLLALLAYTTRPGRLRNVSDRFVVNALAGNVPMSVVALWASWEALSAKSASRLLASEAACNGLAVATLLGVLLVAADQHRAVTDPLRYRSAPHLRRPCVAALGAWGAAGLCAAARVACSVTGVFALSIFSWTYLCVVILPPAFAVGYMHVRVYVAARCSRAAPPGAGAIATVRRHSAGRASAAAALVAALHAPHALAAALTLAPVARAGCYALLAAAACLAPFPLALRSRRVRRNLRRLVRSSTTRSHVNASAGALRLLTAADAEKGEPVSSASSLVAELTASLTLPVCRDDARSSFSSGASTQISAASDE